MTTIQRGFEWFSNGQVPAGRSVYTSDPLQLPQPLYTDPANSFQWIGFDFPSWVPRRFEITYCRFIFEPDASLDWLNMSTAERLIEADIWIDAGAKSYLGGTPPGSESGGDLYMRSTTIFHDWPTPDDRRFYSQWQVPLVPFYLDRIANDHLNIEIGNNYTLAWALMEIGIQTTDTTVWPGY